MVDGINLRKSEGDKMTKRPIRVKMLKIYIALLIFIPLISYAQQ